MKYKIKMNLKKYLKNLKNIYPTLAQLVERLTVEVKQVAGSFQ